MDVIKGNSGNRIPKVKIILEDGTHVRTGPARESDFQSTKKDFIMPLVLLCIASVFGTLAWGGGEILNGLKNSVSNIQTSVVNIGEQQKQSDIKLWQAFTEFKKCENQSMVKCCKDTEIC